MISIHNISPFAVDFLIACLMFPFPPLLCPFLEAGLERQGLTVVPMVGEVGEVPPTASPGASIAVPATGVTLGLGWAGLTLVWLCLAGAGEATFGRKIGRG